MVGLRIDFSRRSRAENIAGCRKSYRASESHSPGIFAVKFCCRYPKLLVQSVMSECEGVSTAISVLLSRFKNLPIVCYYENACNILRSISTRLPWINDKCLIVCDIFHYKRHTCNSVCDPESYLYCSNHLTSSAESLNSL